MAEKTGAGASGRGLLDGIVERMKENGRLSQAPGGAISTEPASAHVQKNASEGPRFQLPPRRDGNARPLAQPENSVKERSFVLPPRQAPDQDVEAPDQDVDGSDQDVEAPDQDNSPQDFREVPPREESADGSAVEPEAQAPPVEDGLEENLVRSLEDAGPDASVFDGEHVPGAEVIPDPDPAPPLDIAPEVDAVPVREPDPSPVFMTRRERREAERAALAAQQQGHPDPSHETAPAGASRESPSNPHASPVTGSLPVTGGLPMMGTLTGSIPVVSSEFKSSGNPRPPAAPPGMENTEGEPPATGTSGVIRVVSGEFPSEAEIRAALHSEPGEREYLKPQKSLRSRYRHQEPTGDGSEDGAPPEPVPATGSMEQVGGSGWKLKDTGAVDQVSHSYRRRGKEPVPQPWEDVERDHRSGGSEDGPRGTGARWSWWILGALAAVAAVVAALWLTGKLGGGPSSGAAASDTVDLAQLKGGECLTGFTDPAARSFNVSECDGRHNAQVVRVEALPTGDFPGQEAVDNDAKERCATIVKERLAEGVDAASLNLSYSVPSETSWESGDRNIGCFVAAKEGLLDRSVVK